MDGAKSYQQRARIGPTFRLTCEAELSRNLHEDFSRLRDKPPSQVEAVVIRTFRYTLSNRIPFLYWRIPWANFVLI